MTIKKGTKLIPVDSVGGRTYFVSIVHKNNTYTLRELRSNKHYARLTKEELLERFEVEKGQDK